jgi:hypothetical protein
MERLIGTSRRGLLVGLLVALGGLASSPAGAITIPISGLSSDSTSAQALAATLEFEVSGSTLTLTVTNRTDGTGRGEYKINRIYFNATSRVSALTLTSPAGWSLDTNAEGGGRFGRFDFAILGGVGQSSSQIDAGGSQTFILSISGNGPFSATDFTTELSRIPTGDTPSLVSAKFVQGPGDDSAFGASVPEPAASAMMLGALLAASRRLRNAGGR